MDMVKEALKELDQRKGVSAQAIRSYIKEKYTTVDETRVKSMVRKALLKGIESGVFVRPVNSNTMTGAQGRFRVSTEGEGGGFFLHEVCYYVVGAFFLFLMKPCVQCVGPFDFRT